MRTLLSLLALLAPCSPLGSDLRGLSEELPSRTEQLLAQLAVSQPLELPRADLLRYALAREGRSVFPLHLVDYEGSAYECDYATPSAPQSSAPEDVNPGADSPTEAPVEHAWLAQLRGVCSVYQKGWWTFEWCHRAQISQYHLGPDGLREPTWSLGSYVEGAIAPAPTGTVRRKKASSGVTQGVEDIFENGQRCDETHKPRHAVVRYRCCGDQEHVRAMREGGVQNARSAAAHILSITERQLCAYEVVVCATALCDHENSVLRERAQRSVEQDVAALSAYEVLRASFGAVCLQRNEGWWTYEVCFSSGVRQFHLTARENAHGQMVPAVEAEFSLGHFHAHALRSSDEGAAGDGNVGRVYTGQAEDGEMAFQLEFEHGTPCDVASLQRATTLEIVCGERNVLGSVVEDRTCHYRIRMTSTELCAHRDFQQLSQQPQRVACRLTSPTDDGADG